MSKPTINDQSARLLLDTHVAVWLADGSKRLKASTLSLIESRFVKGQLCLSPISAWEIGMLVSKDKLKIEQPVALWFADFVHRFDISILEITPEIAINSSFLPGKLHGDPGDRIIVATALAHSIALISADNELISYSKQGFIEVIAC
jgi:PIN domain nuclease of toxin-antitoxin system